MPEPTKAEHIKEAHSLIDRLKELLHKIEHYDIETGAAVPPAKDPKK
jgi:hypothetical protein